MDKNYTINKFSLGIQELSLALGLINYNDIARDLLTGVYKDHSREQLDAQLISAGHSLLARGYTKLSENGNAVLIPELEKAVFPFGKFDYVLEFTVYRENKQVQSTIRVQKGGLFTSQMVTHDVVHVLESGSSEKLLDFILDALNGFAPHKADVREISAPIKLELLGKAINLTDKKQDISNLFSSQDWHEEDIKLISESFTNQIARGAIIRVNADSSTNIENVNDFGRSSLLFLRSKKNSWVFLFDSVDDGSKGIAKIVNRKEFEITLEKFLNQ